MGSKTTITQLFDRARKQVRFGRGYYFQESHSKKQLPLACAVGSLAVAAKCMDQFNSNRSCNFDDLKKKHPALMQRVVHPVFRGKEERDEHAGTMFDVIEDLYECQHWPIRKIRDWVQRTEEELRKSKRRVAQR